MSMPPLLNYAVTTRPVPLQLNASGATVTVVASNPGIYSNDAATNYVAVTTIVVDFGAPGEGGSALTDDASGVGYAGPAGWGIDVTGLQFTFRPPTLADGDRVFPSDGLTFTFSGIAVNGASGTVETSITETASSPGGNPPSFYPPQPLQARNQVVGLGKFPASFSIQSFSANPQAVAPGGQVQLAWTATPLDNATFSLVRTYRGQVQTVTQHGDGAPLAATDTYPNPGKGDTQKLQIDGTSIFTLVVTYTAGGEVIQAQDQVVVAVPAPTITAFTATPSTGLGVGDAVQLAWATVAAESVSITPPLDGLNTQVALSGSATVYPLDFTRYQLVASGGQGLNVQQSLILFPLAPGWTTRTDSAPWSVNQPPMLFALNDILYFYPGAPGSGDNPVYTSPDGKTWLLGNPNTNLSLRRGAAWASNGSTALVTGGTPTAGGGAMQDVWSTTSGTNWTQVAASAAWPARSGAVATWFQGAFWLLGGQNGSAYNDVWSSPDGATWTRKTAAAAWSARSGAALAVMGGNVYLFGGQDASGLQADLWTSTDGTTWVLCPTDPFGSPVPAARQNALLYGLAGRLLLFGGAGVGGALTDAWLWDSANGWTQTGGPTVPGGASNFAGTQYNSGNWLMGGSAGTVFGRSVCVYAE
jgi:hypothetical protein